MMKVIKRRHGFEQRTAALRVTSVYGTVFTELIVFIAGIVPIDVQAFERKIPQPNRGNAAHLIAFTRILLIMDIIVIDDAEHTLDAGEIGSRWWS